MQSCDTVVLELYYNSCIIIVVIIVVLVYLYDYGRVLYVHSFMFYLCYHMCWFICVYCLIMIVL